MSRYSDGRAFRLLPGVEIAETAADETQSLEEEDAPAGRDSLYDKWKLLVTREGVTIEISPTSKAFSSIFSHGVTLKISGTGSTRHDDALKMLERLGAAMLFDLDVVYNLSARLSKRREISRPRRSALPERPPRFPVNEYAGQALELYQYGRAATGLPLLQYLAYYQSVEYFFPFFAREQTMNAVRSQLLHPGFDPRDDVALSRIMRLSTPATRGGISEREQLRATLRASLQEGDLSEFIKSNDEFVQHFEAKAQSIKGVDPLQMKNKQLDLRDQVADRIYVIRCRIVHSKQDGGSTPDDVLLPLSREASSLGADLELLRLVAQRVLLARAARV